VAVVLPFYGDADDAAFALAQLNGLATRPGDELVLADNTPEAVAATAAAGNVTILSCTMKRAVYAARNEGAERSSAPWLLFVDSDCVLPPDLLDRYFDPPPGDAEGAVAGAVAGLPDQNRLISRYTRSRGHLDQEQLHQFAFGPAAVTANLLVRREAFERIGGFQELTRSGGDLDFSFRIQSAGFELGLNTGARVGHHHRESLRPLLKQARRIGSGTRWLGHRHPGYDERFTLSFMARAAAGAVVWPLAGQPERGAFKALDGIWGLACDVGMLDSNVPPGPAPGGARTIVFLETFPVAGDPVTEACARAGAGLQVEAVRRPSRPAWGGVRGRVPMAFREDDAPRDKARAALGLLRRGRRVAPALAPAAARLRAAAPDAAVLVEPALEALARTLAEHAGRADLTVTVLPADRRAAARRIEG
jgi:GT2 family glycosyltransferase